MSEATRTLRLGPYTVEASSLDKILFPDPGITKGQVVEYYEKVAEHALPHLRDRFLTLHRFPDGIGEDGFYQQARADHFPECVGAQSAPRVGGGEIEHIWADNAAGLVYLADQGTITFHGWFSRRDRLHHPDRLVFDLDPPDDDFDAVRHAALRCRGLFEELGLASYVMTTGSRGLHVLLPLDRSADFDSARRFAKNVAQVLARRHGDRLTVEQRKAKRRGRLYLDVARNAYGQTAVLPYSLRARPGAPVATPLRWDELADRDLDARTYTMRNLFRRLGQMDDPWADLARRATGLQSASETLDGLLEETE